MLWWPPFVVTCVAIGIGAAVLLASTSKADWRLLAFAFLGTLPMCALAFFVVRMPLDRIVDWALLGHYKVYRFLTTTYAPLTEEPAKLWPLLIPFFARKVNRRNAVPVAAALGLGFGVGEAWFVASQTLNSPEIALLPWYYLSGFMIERCLVCLMHGAFTSLVVVQIERGWGWRLLGFGGAAAMHYSVNFPIYLATLVPWVQGLIGLWVLVWFAIGLVLLVVLGLRGRRGKSPGSAAAAPI